jgi:hypothetical protein
MLQLAEQRGGPQMLIDMNDLPPTLRAHMEVLRGLVRSALSEFHTTHRELRANYSARTEASIIHDYMVWQAKIAGFPWKVRRNLFLFRLGDYAVKPKKLDTFLRPRNVPTQLVLQFEQQRALRLFDDLDLTHLFLGYQRNGAELVTSSIWLVCPDGRQIKWAAELRADAAAGSIEIAAPSTPGQLVGAPVKRVKAKVAKPKTIPEEAKVGSE